MTDALQNTDTSGQCRYPDFRSLHKAYGTDDMQLRSRDDMSIDEEKAFVGDCYDTYEHIGFAETFSTSYDDKKKYDGMKFTVLGRVKELSEDPENGADLECLPMWRVQAENGDIFDAHPEEICLAERKVEHD